jgi:hypothetical protein
MCCQFDHHYRCGHVIQTMKLCWDVDRDDVFRCSSRHPSAPSNTCAGRLHKRKVTHRHICAAYEAAVRAAAAAGASDDESRRGERHFDPTAYYLLCGGKGFGQSPSSK